MGEGSTNDVSEGRKHKRGSSSELSGFDLHHPYMISDIEAIVSLLDASVLEFVEKSCFGWRIFFIQEELVLFRELLLELLHDVIHFCHIVPVDLSITFSN